MLSRSRARVGVVALVAALAVAQDPAGAARSPTYTVTRGETLSQVAARLRVSVADLARTNGIVDRHRIRAGDRLVLPGRAWGALPSGPPAGPPPPATLRLPERLRQQPQRLALMPRFDAAAREFAVPADLFKALTWLESGWQNAKVSNKGAIGIGQLTPDTVAFVNDVLLRAGLDPHRPEQNIRLSARFLAYLLQRTDGDVEASLSAYYQGLASLRRQGPAPGTRRYVADVLALRAKF